MKNPPPADPLPTVIIHTDGGCHGNPGPGGWAAILQCGPHRRELSGGDPATTNNRMELQAALAALTTLTEPATVQLHTDSSYLRNGITQWLPGWKRNGWLTKEKQPVKNADLWRQLAAAAAPHKITWHWVKGHAGDPGNERCDQLAQQAIAAVKSKSRPQPTPPAPQPQSTPVPPASKPAVSPVKNPTPTLLVEGFLPLDGF